MPKALARKHANDCRAVMRSTLYNRLFPNTRISSAKDTELEFATTLGGNRLATSIGGTLTGRGGNLIVIDDPLKPQDAYSEAARESTKQWYSNTLLSRLDDKTKDAIVVVMQRLHVDDLVGHSWSRTAGRTSICRRSPNPNSASRSAQTRCHLRGRATSCIPNGSRATVLDEFKRSMGSLDFAAQYQQEPVAEGGNLIKWGWFQFYDEPPLEKSGDRIIVSWDTAMSARSFPAIRPAWCSRSGEKQPGCWMSSVSVLNILISAQGDRAASPLAQCLQQTTSL